VVSLMSADGLTCHVLRAYQTNSGRVPTFIGFGRGSVLFVSTRASTPMSAHSSGWCFAQVVRGGGVIIVAEMAHVVQRRQRAGDDASRASFEIALHCRRDP